MSFDLSESFFDEAPADSNTLQAETINLHMIDFSSSSLPTNTLSRQRTTNKFEHLLTFADPELRRFLHYSKQLYFDHNGLPKGYETTDQTAELERLQTIADELPSARSRITSLEAETARLKAAIRTKTEEVTTLEQQLEVLEDELSQVQSTQLNEDQPSEPDVIRDLTEQISRLTDETIRLSAPSDEGDTEYYCSFASSADLRILQHCIEADYFLNSHRINFPPKSLRTFMQQVKRKAILLAAMRTPASQGKLNIMSHAHGPNIYNYPDAPEPSTPFDTYDSDTLLTEYRNNDHAIISYVSGDLFRFLSHHTDDEYKEVSLGRNHSCHLTRIACPFNWLCTDEFRALPPNGSVTKFLRDQALKVLNDLNMPNRYPATFSMLLNSLRFRDITDELIQCVAAQSDLEIADETSEVSAT